jgi:hypothetical protein
MLKRRVNLKVACILGMVLVAGVALAQSSKQASDTVEKQEPGLPGRSSNSDATIHQEVTTTLKVSTRIVVEEVLVLNDEDQAVTDLKAEDFQVFETGKSHKLSQTVSSFRLVESTQSPVPWAVALDLPIRRATHCGVQTIPPHYEISYYPTTAPGENGPHHILITCRRHHVRLLYRKEYVMTVGPETTDQAQTGVPAADKSPSDPALARAACDQPPTQPMPLKAAYSIKTDRPDLLKYSLAFDATRFTFVSRGKDYALTLDYAVCVKDAEEHRLHYAQGGTEQLLTAEEYKSAQQHGFPFDVELHKIPNLANVQITVRDRETGRVSTVRIRYGQSAEKTSVAQVPSAGPTPSHSGAVDRESSGTFGTTVPIPSALCGELYLLNPGELGIPSFLGLDSVGALYTTRLNVPDHFFLGDVPFVGGPDQMFAIDYQGVFWADESGEYRFLLGSDDGSVLYIDGKRIINNDGVHPILWEEGIVSVSRGEHTIRVAYFQGAPVDVALILKIKPPGKGWMFFDTRQFARPGDK